MAKYYFRYGDDICYNIECHFDFMQKNRLSEMKVFEARRLLGLGYFFCKHYKVTGEVRQGCGVQLCESYVPNNGKNGRCKHYGYVYEQTGKTILLIKNKFNTMTKKEVRNKIVTTKLTNGRTYHQYNKGDGTTCTLVTYRFGRRQSEFLDGEKAVQWVTSLPQMVEYIQENNTNV